MAAKRKKKTEKPQNSAPVERLVIRPQSGPQEVFLGTNADIAIYGGAAGGGKTWAALIEPLRHVAVHDFEATIFRRTLQQVRQSGGLLVESMKLYSLWGATCNLSSLIWTFPSGMQVRFSQLQHEKTKLTYMGSQMPCIIFDELTHFTEGQFFYLVSRMRSMSGVRSYIRATCNPDADSWVAEFISWWIDQDSGLAITERSGKIRWFVRDGDKLLWADSKAELRLLVPKWDDKMFRPKSVTFIAATVYDNAALLEADPDYLANLMALPLVDREQLLGGNWKIKPAAGLLFKERWFHYVKAAPANRKKVRIWDFASTEPTTSNKDPDYTVGTLLSYGSDKRFYIEHIERFRGSPLEVENAVKKYASSDGVGVTIYIPEDPAQAGKFQNSYFKRELGGYNVRTYPQSKNKIERSKPASAQAESGNILIVDETGENKAPWIKDFLIEAERFGDPAAHDDQIDTLSAGVTMLSQNRTLGG